MKSLSNIVWSKGIALSNISMGALILLYYSFIGTSSLPMQILMPRMQISWLVTILIFFILYIINNECYLNYQVGGLVGSYALN